MVTAVIKKLVIVLLCLLMICAYGFSNPARAQSEYVGVLTINPDGSMSPVIPQIKQTGNTYELTTDVKAQIQIFIHKSDIVFDGHGHVLGNGKTGNIVLKNYENSVLSNVTIKNFFINQTITNPISIYNSVNVTIENNTVTGTNIILGQTTGIFLSSSNSSKIIGNTVQGTTCGIDLLNSRDNLIVGNTVHAISDWAWNDFPAAIMLDIYYGEKDIYASGSSNNLIYGNIFVCNRDLTAINGNPNNSWDNGSIGNYWSDYSIRYPNATEVDSTGIGNTPYVINESNVDHYPFTQPEDINSVIPTPTPSVPELSWLTIVPLFAITLIGVVAVRRRFNNKKRHQIA
jgi:parallel beta-helix repeat protein